MNTYRLNFMITSFRTTLILIINDRSLADGVNFLVRSASDFRIMAEFNEINKLVLKKCAESPSVIIVELNVLDSLESLAAIKAASPKSEIIAISNNTTTIEMLTEAMTHGASAILSKSDCSREILNTIETVQNNGAVLSPRFMRQVLQLFHKSTNSPLSVRESQVVKLLSKGYTSTLIGDELFISHETAKVHIKNIYKKLNVKTKFEMLQRVREERLVEMI